MFCICIAATVDIVEMIKKSPVILCACSEARQIWIALTIKTVCHEGAVKTLRQGTRL